MGPATDVEALDAVIYKGTTLPHIVVRRRCLLTPEGFVTYQVDKNSSSGKIWQLHRRTVLEPQSAAQIRAHERHLRKAGPLRALSAYARDKNVLKLFCFRVEWPDKYAPSHGSSVELGFDSLDKAREWYLAISAHVEALGGGSNGASLGMQYSVAGLSHSNRSGAGLYSGTGYASVEPSPFTSPVSSMPNTPSLLRKRTSADGYVLPMPADTADSDSSTLGATHGHNSSQDLLLQIGSAPNTKALRASGLTGKALRPVGGSIHSSSSGSGSGQLNQQQSSADTAVLAAAMRAHSAAQQGNSTTGVVVDECMVRWVPYKHANGMAIYYRQTPPEEGKGMPQASGEYMLSTAVQASPECCVSNLMLKADKNGSILSTAAFMEVLEDNGDMQVWHMVFHPAGNAGLATVLAAPRYTFMHQVLTSYEEGVYAVLFSSVPDEDVKPEWIERANARTQWAHSAVIRSDPGSGRRMPLWRTPVRCRITGAITLSALEGRTGRDSPQTLVTCIVRADFGGWLSSKSIFCGLGQALGLQEALMDRVLMRVMILKEDVEYNRFKTKPFQLLTVTSDEYEGSNHQQQQQQQYQQQQCVQRPSLPAQQLHYMENGELRQTVLLQPAPARRSPSSSAVDGVPAAVAVSSAEGAETGQQSTSDRDLVSRTQSAAGAVAVAAAARVSAAASALAAHMTNPQQLWHEKRGSSAGYGGMNTPPHSPQKHSLGGELMVVLSRSKTSSTATEMSGRRKANNAALEAMPMRSKSSGAATEVTASAGASALAKAAAVQQQHRDASEPYSTQPSAVAGDAVSPAAVPDQDRFFSVSGAANQDIPVAAAAGAVADLHASQLLQDNEDDIDSELFVEAADGSVTSSSVASAADVADACSAAGQAGVMPYSEEQLQALIGGSLNRQYWEPIHDGVGTVRDVYSIRGPNYLKDKKKIPAGRGRYKLMAADLVATEHMMDHIGRFLPSVRCNGAAFSFVVDLIINYGSPVLHLVMVYSTDKHPNSLGPCPDDPLDAGDEWTPFDFTMSRFLHGTDEERNGMFKLIPHCAKGSWVVTQSVGTTPVILGRKLITTYHQHDRYIEVDVDVASTQAVAYIVKMVQGATRSMLIDHAYLLESQFAHELPEQLIGAIRYKHLDMTDYTFIQVEQELPFAPVVPGIVGQ